MSKSNDVNRTFGKVIKFLIEYCINHKIFNPKIEIDATTTDGEHYRMIFERLDLDEMMSNLISTEE